MSVEMFLKVDGITGGSRNYDHKGWSDVTSWGWGMVSNRQSAKVTENDKTSFKEITITKRIGVESSAIMSLYANGKPIQNVTLDIIPQVGKKEVKQKYMSLRMEDVLVKSIITGGNSSEDFFNENIIFLFSRIRFEFNLPVLTTVENTSEAPAGYKFGWDIGENKEWLS